MGSLPRAHNRRETLNPATVASNRGRATMSFNDVVARMICKSRYVRTVKGAPRALPWLSRDIFLVRKNANFFFHSPIILFFYSR